MNYDNNSIETIGVSALNKYFGFSDTLHPSFTMAEKNPVWDGYLLLYQNKEGKNINDFLVGKIMVQIKTHCRIESGDSIKYALRVNDLRIFKDNGGVAYVVVYVNPQTQQETIYYRLIAPIELRGFINEAGNKKTHSIKFYRLPDLSSKVEHEFYDFFQDCKNQLSFADQKSLHLEDIKDELYSLNFSITCDRKDEIKAFEEMSTRPSFLYATLIGDNTNTFHPIGNSRFQFAFSKTISEFPIKVGGKLFYNDTSLEIDNGNYYIVFGNRTFKFPILRKNEEFDGCFSVSVTPTFSSLNPELLGLEFILSVIKYGEFNYGNFSIKLKSSSMEYASNVQTRYDSLKRIKKVLDILHVKEDLTLKNLSAEEVENLNLLTRHYLDGLYVYPNGPKENQRVIIKISNISLWFLFEYDDCRDSYDMISACDLSSRMFRITTPDNQIVRVPYFAAFDRNTFEKACNINYSDFVHECKNLEPCNQTQIDYIIYLLFVMLNAYDAQQKKNPELLQTAFDICKWINDVNEEEKNIIDYKLHLFQIIKRKRKFNDEEIGFLYEVLDSEESDCEIKFVVNILLDNKRAAKRYFEKLNVEKQTELSQMPIYRFM